jgi:hypothetical protein
LKCVEARLRDKLPAGTWHWRSDEPFDTLPADRDLLIEAGGSFRLHMGFDGWQAVSDRPSEPLPFGRHGVRLTRSDLAGRTVLDFTLYRIEPAQWDAGDSHVRLT